MNVFYCDAANNGICDWQSGSRRTEKTTEFGASACWQVLAGASTKMLLYGCSNIVPYVPLVCNNAVEAPVINSGITGS